MDGVMPEKNSPLASITNLENPNSRHGKLQGSVYHTTAEEKVLIADRLSILGNPNECG